MLAGPGSGKTRVITHRIAWLIEQGIRPWNILAITFTNKAAAEMRERLGRMDVPAGTTLCTFHALAARLLREHHEAAGLSAAYTIYDTADQKAAVRDAIKRLELDSQRFQPAKILARISNLKNDLVTVERYAQDSEGDYVGSIVAKVYKLYQETLVANNALDFDDLIMRLSLLLRDREDLRDQLNEKYQYLLVDEYQDTNSCQYQIARGLSLNHQNLCVSGDPDQSIYAWRGANIQNILAFEQDYPDATVVRLEENFRSTPQVLHLAEQIIKQNTQRKEKNLFTSNPQGPVPVLKEYDDEHAEAAAMVDWIKANANDGLEYRNMAVFYRVNSMSRVLEEALRHQNVPYQIVRGVEFFQRKEIKDMLAYLRFIANPDDQLSLARIINSPPRGIGATTVQRLIDHAQGNQQSIDATLHQLDEIETLNAGARSKVRRFINLIDQLREMADKSIARLTEEVYTLSGIEEQLAAPMNEDQAANVDELINSAAQYDAGTESPSLLEYLQQIALVSDADSYDAQAGAISLMTLHAAKGLEFPAVLIVGLEDGLIPHSRSAESDDDLEEERRLLFVGITRAEQRLGLSYARHRTTHGASLATIRSPFVRDLDGLDMQVESTSQPDRHEDRFERFPSRSSTRRRKAPEPAASSDEPYYDSSDSQVDELPYKEGQLVRHPKFGLGRVESVTAAGSNSTVTVSFNSAGVKTIHLKYVQLEPVANDG